MQCYEICKELNEEEEKKFNLVLLGVLEGNNETETIQNDLQLTEKIISQCGLQTVDIEKTFQHGIKRGIKPRTLKLKFKNINTPKQILTTMREKSLYSSLLPPRSRIRRDLTTSEQIKERDARKESYRRNNEEGIFKWTVNNEFDVILSKNERPWDSPTATNTL